MQRWHGSAISCDGAEVIPLPACSVTLSATASSFFNITPLIDVPRNPAPTQTSPDYCVKVSARARRLSLRVEPGRGAIVTIPRGVSQRHVPAFVARHRQWIEARLAEAERQIPERFRQWPPRQLSLPAIDRVLELSFQTDSLSNAQSPDALSAGNLGRQQRLPITADSSDRPAVVSELQVALKVLARQYFPVRLAMLASAHSMHYERVQIRGQRTRWGSCSSRGTISLNYKLLFLSPALVDYVLLHELAHTRHLDHSPAFWRQLTSMLANARQLDAMLNEAGREVPPWIDLHCA